MPTVPHGNTRQRRPAESARAEAALHGRINRIRECVRRWREQGRPGAGRQTSALLDHWHGSVQGRMRPFFCQVEAAETLVWLFDADEDGDLARIRGEVRRACYEYNGNLLRYATKMATGTGKTLVMAMLIAWLSMRREGRADIVVIVPNLTVKERLSELVPGSGSIYESILPAGWRLPADTRVTIINCQKFVQRDGLRMAGEKADSRTARLVTGGGPRPDEWKEDPEVMIDRLLPYHRGAPVVVINDEAHHCYRPGGKIKGDRDVADSRTAALWFAALEHLRDEGRLEAVFDMSATVLS